MRSAAEVERRCGSGVVCGGAARLECDCMRCRRGWSATVLMRKGAGGGGAA